MLSHEVSYISVKDLQGPLVAELPWFVDWLNCIDSWVVAPSRDKTVNSVLSPEQIVEVDEIVTLSVPWAHPFGSLDLPVSKVVLVFPCKFGLLSRVIKTVLASSDGVHVEQDFYANLSELVESPFDLLFSAVHAAFVWTVWLESPVANWDTDELNVTIFKLLEMLLLEPFVPMSAHDLVAQLGSEGLTEGPAVHADALAVCLTEESVEERWRDPWLKDHPASDVGADHGLGINGCRDSGKSSNEASHLKLFTLNL